MQSVACLSSISTGIYGYPIELAATIAVTTVRSSLRGFADIEGAFLLLLANDLTITRVCCAQQQRDAWKWMA
jgi:O-acetyl-ADP-ribose deacetylase (regulator of RNase III)